MIGQEGTHWRMRSFFFAAYFLRRGYFLKYETNYLLLVSFSFLMVVSAALAPFSSLKATGLGECPEGGVPSTISGIILCCPG